MFELTPRAKMFLALKKSGKTMYDGSVKPSDKERRRKKNRAARSQRKRSK